MALSAMRAARSFHDTPSFERPRLMKRVYLFRLGTYGLLAAVTLCPPILAAAAAPPRQT